ncbi:hypothetical protein J500_3295 [Acinetobacter sp. 479375]|jgi:hypothetical protein|nr:hypothetical protein J500_3295 [Acinetobacter sp. 479375]
MYLPNPQKDNQHLQTKIQSMHSFGKELYKINKRRGCIILN